MSFRLIYFGIFLCLLPAQSTAQAKPPQAAGSRQAIAPDLNRLIPRAAEHWRLSAAGERVKAASFVLPAKREDFLNGASMPVAGPKVVGLLFTDNASRVLVQVSLRSLVALGDKSPQWTLQQPWVWSNNNWFIDFQPAENPFGAKPISNSAQTAKVKYLEQHFTLKTTHISAGTLWAGESKEFPIEFAYTGDAPVRLDTDQRFPFLGLDPTTSQYVKPGTGTTKLGLDPEQLDGAFALPVHLNVYYQDVVLEKTINIEGTVFRPVVVRQDPEVLPRLAKTEFTIILKNNLDDAVGVNDVAPNPAVKILAHPSSIAPHAEATLRVALEDITGEPEPVRVNVFLPSRGLRQVTIPLRIQPPQ